MNYSVSRGIQVEMCLNDNFLELCVWKSLLNVKNFNIDDNTQRIRSVSYIQYTLSAKYVLETSMHLNLIQLFSFFYWILHKKIYRRSRLDEERFEEDSKDRRFPINKMPDTWWKWVAKNRQHWFLSAYRKGE